MAIDEDYQEPARTDGHPGDGASRSTGRMEAFADAVFAIAFTLPIVEIELPSGGVGFGARLVHLWPSYLAYGLASLVIGIFWVHHHFAGAIYRTTGHYFNLATVVFLAAIGFVAFPARAFAEHIEDPASRPAAAILFVLTLFATTLSWLIKWTVGSKSGHVDHRLDEGYVARLDRRYRTSALMMAVAVGLSLAQWEVGVAVAMVILLSYLQAPETPIYRAHAPTVEGEN